MIIKRCEACGKDFETDAEWKVLCWPCWKLENPPKTTKGVRAAENRIALRNALTRIVLLESELLELRTKLASVSLPPDMLRKLLQLTHPDKHNHSKLANEVTAWLLSLKR